MKPPTSKLATAFQDDNSIRVVAGRSSNPESGLEKIFAIIDLKHSFLIRMAF